MQNIRIVPQRTAPLCIAAAQSPSIAGAPDRNVQVHLAFVEAAARRGVQVLVFPELSLTGYEPDLMAHHVLDASHPTLAPLRAAARQHGISLLVGAPAASAMAVQDALVSIGTWVLSPDGNVQLYCKRYLHSSESTFASPGQEDALVMELAGEPIGLSVCADLTHPKHAEDARRAGAQVYAASALISSSGYGPESALLQGYAARHHMTVLLANYSGSSGGYASAGRSVIWAPGGTCVIAAANDAPSLVWARRDPLGWLGGVDAVAVGS